MSARAHYQYSRNQPSDQKRNLKPTVSSQGAYSASPSQLTLSSDIPSAGLPNPYHQPYPYVPNPHDPSAFAFPQPGYRPPLQAQPPPHHQQPPPPHAPQVSPSNSRKRRASELGGGDQQNLQGPPSNNASPFTNPTGLVPGPGGDMNVGMGPPQQQQQQQHAQPSPAPKKGRTNTPWTPAEEQRLKTMRDAGSSWSEIAKTFPTRTEGSVKKHWYKDMHYADFAEDEVSNFSAALLQAIKDYENNKWKVIGQKVGKPAKACEQFAKEQGWKV